MKLEDLKKDMPRTPDFIHEMIREEVERQIKDDKVLHISERKRILHMGKTAAAAVVCALAVSTAVYAGSRLYHMYLEKTGKYSTSVGIETEKEQEEISLPEKIHDIEIQADYIPEGMEWSDESHLTYSENPYNGGFTISSVLMDKEDLEAVLVDTGVVESEERVFGKYSGVYLRYQNLTEDASFDQRIYLLCPEEYRVGGRHSFELGYQGMKRLLTMEGPPTAVILSNYDTTLGGILALNESGRNCPEDISVIGFDDLLLSKVIRPRLWIVSQPMREMSSRAVQMLLERITHQEEGGPVRVSFAASIRQGDSVRRLL